MSAHHRLQGRLLTGLLIAGCGSDPASATVAVKDASAQGDAAVLDAAARELPVEAGVDASVTAEPLRLTSPAFSDQGTLPREYTCDGVGTSPPLEWSGAPLGTVELVLLVTTVAKDGLKWNWVLRAIPPSATELAAGSSLGVTGLTSDGPELGYSPPCSQGPGAKAYTFTLYALSDHPSVPVAANQVTGAVMTEAIRDLTLARSALTVSYTR